MMPAGRRPRLRTPTSRLSAAAIAPALSMNVSFGNHAPSENCHTGLAVSRMLPWLRWSCHQMVYSSDTWSAGGLFRSKLRPEGNSSFLSVAYRKYSDTVEIAEKDQKAALNR